MTIVQLTDKLAAIRQQQAKLAKDEADIRSQLDAEIKKFIDLLHSLGIDIIPPKPVDPLVKSFQDAYAATPADEKPLVQFMAIIWANEANNLAKETTNDDVLASLIKGRKTPKSPTDPTPIIGDSQLRAIRDLADAQLESVFGKPSKALTDEMRKAGKDKMLAVVGILNQLK